jgi:outer membrane receptor protein involved in Fe transport
MRNHARSVSTLLIGVSAIAFSGAAFAQDAAPPPRVDTGAATAPGTADGTDQAADPERTAQDIVVTGSRLTTNGNNSPTPLTVVSTDELLTVQPTSVAAALQNLPVFQGSMGQSSGTGGGQGGPNGAANAPNIRNIGVYRTLTLFDGKRVQPTTDTGLVTIDMLPQMLLKRVDVVTGGVSAVYGSDAISGVVNFVTDRSFNGLSLKAQSGISQYGDGAIRDLGVAFGTDLFGGRGHFEASLEYYDDAGIFDMSSRHVGQLWQIEGGVRGSAAAAGTAANPFQLYSNVHNATTSFGGLIRSGPLAGMTFSSNGVLTAFQHGAATGTSGFEVGGDGAYNYNSSLKGALLARRAFARFDFDLSDSVHFYAEGFGAKNRNTYNDTSLTFTNLALRSQNPFLPAAYQYGTPTSSFTLSKISQQLGPHTKIFNLTSYWANAGFEGAFGNGFKWEVGGSHGYSEQEWVTARNINLQHLGAALDAVTSGGNTVCQINVDAITTNDDPACAPLNLFGPTAASQQALDYVTDTTVATTTTRLTDLTASVTGSPFSSWAGPVELALSGEWRRVSLSSTSEIPPEDKANCSGIRYNCTQGTTNLHQVTFGIIRPVHQTVKEVALEAEIPLLKDVPLARSVSLNLAGRYADYDTFGGATTWKVGLNWRVSGELLLRATRSRDFRAPNLSNLYQPATVSRTNVIDQLTGQALSNVPSQGGGNPDLKPEIGNTLTAGVVYKPDWLPGFSISVDAYDIKILDAITNLNGTNTTVQRLCNASNGTSPLCDLIVRPNPYTDTSPANNATYFYNVPINAASIHTRGVDFEANYATQLFDNPFSVRVLVTYQPMLKQVTPSLADVDVAGVAYSSVGGLGATPKWRATAFANYSPDEHVRISVSQRWRSALSWNTDPTLYYAEPNIPAFGWTNLNLSFTPGAGKVKPEIYFNVQNLFDTKAPIAINSSSDTGRFGAYIASDDVVGRYFTTGVRLKF